MKVKLGQEIQFRTSHKVEISKGGIALVKPGDRARVVKKIDEKTAEIVYLTGEAKDLSNRIPLEVDDTIDTDSMVKKIMYKLNHE